MNTDLIDLTPLIRSDPAGDGQYLASRGDSLHKGVDLLWTPNAIVPAPIDGEIIKVIQVYNHTTEWKGVRIQGSIMCLDMFYVNLIVNQGPVKQSQPIAVAQDITKEYPDQGMRPHIHIQVRHCDPLVLWRKS